jgi:hypothetical protein
MKVKGLIWLGTRTAQFEAMFDFCKEALGMAPVQREPGLAVLDMPNGDRIEIFAEDSPEHAFMTHPVAGFLVDDLAAARAELEARGIEFIGPIHSTEMGYAWTHFRAPDGFVYELTFDPNRT